RPNPGAGMKVILDHHLEAQRRVPEERDQQQDHQNRWHGRAQPADERLVTAAAERDERGGEPHGQGHERDRRHPLGPPMLEPRLGGAEADGAAERRANAIPTHRLYLAISRLATQAANVRTTLAATTSHPEA